MQVDVLMLSAAHPPDDVRILRKQGAALAAAGWRVMHLCPAAPDAPAEMAGVAITTYPRRPGWWGRIRNIPRLAALARRDWGRSGIEDVMLVTRATPWEDVSRQFMPVQVGNNWRLSAVTKRLQRGYEAVLRRL